MTIQDLIEAVKAHALANYESDGWDFVIETQEDSDLAAIIGDAKTAAEAIARVGAEFKTLADYRDDIIGAGGAYDTPVDTWQEHCDYEANARYDYISEAYGSTALDAEYEAASDDAQEEQERLAFYDRTDWLYLSDEEADKLAIEAGYDSAGDCDDERLNRWAEMHSPPYDPAGMLPRPLTRAEYKRRSAPDYMPF